MRPSRPAFAAALAGIGILVPKWLGSPLGVPWLASGRTARAVSFD